MWKRCSIRLIKRAICLAENKKARVLDSIVKALVEHGKAELGKQPPCISLCRQNDVCPFKRDYAALFKARGLNSKIGIRERSNLMSRV